MTLFLSFSDTISLLYDSFPPICLMSLTAAVRKLNLALPPEPGSKIRSLERKNTSKKENSKEKKISFFGTNLEILENPLNPNRDKVEKFQGSPPPILQNIVIVRVRISKVSREPKNSRKFWENIETQFLYDSKMVPLTSLKEVQYWKNLELQEFVL